MPDDVRRPPRRRRKTVQVTLRMSPEEYSRLAQEAEARGETVSETVRRKCALSPKPEK